MRSGSRVRRRRGINDYIGMAPDVEASPYKDTREIGFGISAPVGSHSITNP